MLAFDDDQMEIIMSYARPLAPRDRSEFLQDVASELRRYETLGPGLVTRVCASAQRKFFAAPSMRNGIGGKWR